MCRTRLLPGQPHPPQQLGKRRERVGHAPEFPGAGGDVAQTVTADPVHLRVWPSQHPGAQVFLLYPVQPPGRPCSRAVVQPGQALGVVAPHRIAQGLTLPPDQPGRFRPARAFQHSRDRQRPQGRTSIRLAPGKAPQGRRVQVVADLQATSRHHCLPKPGRPRANHTPTAAPITSESAGRTTGISVRAPERSRVVERRPDRLLGAVGALLTLALAPPAPAGAQAPRLTVIGAGAGVSCPEWLAAGRSDPGLEQWAFGFASAIASPPRCRCDRAATRWRAWTRTQSTLGSATTAGNGRRTR